MNVRTEQLILDNMKLVYFVISKHYPNYKGDDDLIQVGMMGLIKAAETWEESVSKFSTYAHACIHNEIRNEFRKQSKHYNNYSLDYEYLTEEGDCVKLSDIVVGDDDVDFIDIMDFIGDFGDKNNEILRLSEQGFTNKEIAKMYGVSKQAITERKRRMKLKWEKKNGYTD